MSYILRAFISFQSKLILGSITLFYKSKHNMISQEKNTSF